MTVTKSSFKYKLRDDLYSSATACLGYLWVMEFASPVTASTMQALFTRGL